MDNEQNNHSSNSTLKDYEIELDNKKDFFASLVEKIKQNKEQKLLNSGTLEKTHTTNMSISSMWGFGNIRTSFFSALENIQSSIFKQKQPEIKNTLATQVVSENSPTLESTSQDKTISDIAQTKNVIIPKVKTPTPKSIIDNSKTAEDIGLENESKNPEEKNAINNVSSDLLRNNSLESNPLASYTTIVNPLQVETIIISPDIQKDTGKPNNSKKQPNTDKDSYSRDDI